MSKDEEIKFDEIPDGGDDFDLDDLDSIMSGSKPPPKNAREAVMNTAGDIGEGFIGSFTDDPHKTAMEFAEAALPDSISSEVADISAVKDNVFEEGEKQLEAVKKEAVGFLKTADKLIPDGWFLKDISHKVKGMLGVEDEGEKAKKKQLEDNAEVDRHTGEVTAFNLAEQRKAEAIEQALQQHRHKDNIQLLSHIAINTEHTVDFLAKSTQTYYKKSIELQVKSLLVQKDLLAIHKESTQTTKSQLESIVKNTALPEIIKVRQSEAMIADIYAESRKALSTAFYSEANPLMVMQKNLINKVKGIGSQIKEGFSNAKDMVDMFGGMIDPEMMEHISPWTMAGGMAGDLVKNKMIGGLRKRLSNTEGSRNLAFHVKNLAHDPEETLKDFSKYVKDSSIGKTWTGRQIANVSNFFSRMARGGTEADPRISRGAAETIKSFDNLAHKSVVKVVPDLLSKILARVDVIVERMGGKAPDPGKELVYNYEQDKLITRSQYRNQFKRSIKKEFQETTVKRVDSLLARILEAGNAKFKEDEIEALRKALTMYALNKPNLSLRGMRKGTQLETAFDIRNNPKNERLYKRFKNNLEFIEKAAKKDTEKLDIIDDINGELRALTRANTNFSNQINRAVRDGHGADIKGMKFINFDSTGNVTLKRNAIASYQYNNFDKLADKFKPEVLKYEDRQKVRSEKPEELKNSKGADEKEENSPEKKGFNTSALKKLEGNLDKIFKDKTPEEIEALKKDPTSIYYEQESLVSDRFTPLAESDKEETVSKIEQAANAKINGGVEPYKPDEIIFVNTALLSKKHKPYFKKLIDKYGIEVDNGIATLTYNMLDDNVVNWFKDHLKGNIKDTFNQLDSNIVDTVRHKTPIETVAEPVEVQSLKDNAHKVKDAILNSEAVQGVSKVAEDLKNTAFGQKVAENLETVYNSRAGNIAKEQIDKVKEKADDVLNSGVVRFVRGALKTGSDAVTDTVKESETYKNVSSEIEALANTEAVQKTKEYLQGKLNDLTERNLVQDGVNVLKDTATSIKESSVGQTVGKGIDAVAESKIGQAVKDNETVQKVTDYVTSKKNELNYGVSENGLVDGAIGFFRNIFKGKEADALKEHAKPVTNKVTDIKDAVADKIGVVEDKVKESKFYQAVQENETVQSGKEKIEEISDAAKEKLIEAKDKAKGRLKYWFGKQESEPEEKSNIESKAEGKEEKKEDSEPKESKISLASVKSGITSMKDGILSKLSEWRNKEEPEVEEKPDGKGITGYAADAIRLGSNASWMAAKYLGKSALGGLAADPTALGKVFIKTREWDRKIVKWLGKTMIKGGWGLSKMLVSGVLKAVAVSAKTMLKDLPLGLLKYTVKKGTQLAKGLGTQLKEAGNSFTGMFKEGGRFSPIRSKSAKEHRLEGIARAKAEALGTNKKRTSFFDRFKEGGSLSLIKSKTAKEHRLDNISRIKAETVGTPKQKPRNRLLRKAMVKSLRMYKALGKVFGRQEDQALQQMATEEHMQDDATRTAVIINQHLGHKLNVLTEAIESNNEAIQGTKDSKEGKPLTEKSDTKELNSAIGLASELKTMGMDDKEIQKTMKGRVDGGLIKKFTAIDTKFRVPTEDEKNKLTNAVLLNRNKTKAKAVVDNVNEEALKKKASSSGGIMDFLKGWFGKIVGAVGSIASIAGSIASGLGFATLGALKSIFGKSGLDVPTDLLDKGKPNIQKAADAKTNGTPDKPDKLDADNKKPDKPNKTDINSAADEKIDKDGKKADAKKESKKGIMDRLKSSIKGLKDKFHNAAVKKLGKNAGKKLALRIAGSIARCFIPIAGIAITGFFVALAVKYYFADKLDIWGALSKAFAGFNIFGDDTPVDEDGNPIKPDALEDKLDEQKKGDKEEKSKIEQSSEDKVGTVSKVGNTSLPDYKQTKIATASSVAINGSSGGTCVTPGANPMSYPGLKFDKSVDIENLNPALRDAIVGLGEDVAAEGMTPIQINAGKRSLEQQAALYKKYGPGRAAKPNPLAPHISGVAFDMNSADANKLEDKGLLDKHNLWRPLKDGLGRTPKEPWHVEIKESRDPNTKKITPAQLSKIDENYEARAQLGTGKVSGVEIKEDQEAIKAETGGMTQSKPTQTTVSAPPLNKPDGKTVEIGKPTASGAEIVNNTKNNPPVTNNSTVNNTTNNYGADTSGLESINKEQLNIQKEGNKIHHLQLNAVREMAAALRDWIKLVEQREAQGKNDFTAMKMDEPKVSMAVNLDDY